MANKAALLKRMEILEQRTVTTSDAWWRQMCERYGHRYISIDDTTRAERNAVLDAYLNDFY